MIYNIASLEKPQNGRRIAIGDIHGCIVTFKALWQQLEIEKEDQVFLLGDLINTGKASKEVVDYTIKLLEESFQIFTIKGNHEQAFLQHYKKGMDNFQKYLGKNNSGEFLNSQQLSTYVEFFKSLEYCYDLGDWLVCHSHFSVQGKKRSRSMQQLFPKVAFQFSEDLILSRKQIVGHTPTKVKKVKEQIRKQKTLICIDSGCVYIKEKGMGFLTAFDLDTHELIFQPNID